jgi:tRNA-splicing ligase RtcB (3'-phosphate/5'-hydroxy nucleic acid ligase)
MGIHDENLHPTPLPYRIWGQENIDDATIKQMDSAMRLPISVQGALMPDAHLGYGLPIGGVLATEGAVIPYAVGVDIACRMRLSIYPLSPIVLQQQAGKFENALIENTVFGTGGEWRGKQTKHEVLDDRDWVATGFLNHLHDLACRQLGTSGTGNHFVEWGTFKLKKYDEELNLEVGTYLALLSHSGSRGVGFKIANHYSKAAMGQHPKLDKTVQHLAWLPLGSELGQEYWIAMELAGRFAAANHQIIHKQVSKAAGVKPMAVVENHHNFAWKETIPAPEGSNDSVREVIVHRKGATPASEGVLGVIPGSMADPGYVVRGKGNSESVDSAAHGAGRLMSRRAALKSITKTERDRYLREREITLIGGDLDEAPQAYKNIDKVMAAQADLVEIIASFEPRIVQMDDGKKHPRHRNKGGKKKSNKHKRR